MFFDYLQLDEAAQDAPPPFKKKIVWTYEKNYFHVVDESFNVFV